VLVHDEMCLVCLLRLQSQHHIIGQLTQWLFIVLGFLGSNGYPAVDLEQSLDEVSRLERLNFTNTLAKSQECFPRLLGTSISEATTGLI